MKALILHAPQRLEVGEWPTPKCGPGDVIIRPIAAGICAGDMQHYSGRNPYTTYPLVCGHEVCGVVTEVGAKVRRCRRDDLVVIEPVVGCGRCHPDVGRQLKGPEIQTLFAGKTVEGHHDIEGYDFKSYYEPTGVFRC